MRCRGSLYWTYPPLMEAQTCGETRRPRRAGKRKKKETGMLKKPQRKNQSWRTHFSKPKFMKVLPSGNTVQLPPLGTSLISVVLYRWARFPRREKFTDSFGNSIWHSRGVDIVYSFVGYWWQEDRSGRLGELSAHGPGGWFCLDFFWRGVAFYEAMWGCECFLEPMSGVNVVWKMSHCQGWVTHSLTYILDFYNWVWFLFINPGLYTGLLFMFGLSTECISLDPGPLSCISLFRKKRWGLQQLTLSIYILIITTH